MWVKIELGGETLRVNMDKIRSYTYNDDATVVLFDQPGEDPKEFSDGGAAGRALDAAVFGTKEDEDAV